jgi:hypothetical protein
VLVLVGQPGDRGEDASEVSEEFFAGHAQDADAAFLHPRVAALVVDELVVAVGGAVDLDDEAGLGAVEVGDVGAHRVLLAEAQAAELLVLEA